MGFIRILEFAARTYGGFAGLFCVAVAALIINTKITRRSADQWWRDHLDEFAPGSAKKTIARRDDRIRLLEHTVSELSHDRRSLIDAVRAAAIYADRARELLTQPEIIRVSEKQKRRSS